MQKGFKRLTGVKKQTFKRMLKAWKDYHLTQSNAGRPPEAEPPQSTAGGPSNIGESIVPISTLLATGMFLNRLFAVLSSVSRPL